ncbi:nucleotidyltransferase domain-containing protein [Candidatus Woesearchaeota archaeon]|nr:nucleotidyltransferase domain-containing protein [Candidatus Woesearchaeota archaeon]
MAKKQTIKKDDDPGIVVERDELAKKLPPDAQKKLDQIKGIVDRFQKKAIDKFDKYVSGIALLPPDKKEGSGEPDVEKINLMVLIDDQDSQRLPKEDLKEKITAIINGYAAEVDKRLSPQMLLLSELWTACFDAKYDLLDTIAMGAPIYDTGMLAAIRIAEVHKNMVLKKFEKYIVSYVLSGSLIRGEATPDSDIDVFIVIDDTDVKKMTRAELKDKLRAIIIGMGMEAGEVTGIKNKINIQVYILTDFWDSLREANPVIFTLLRDGVPFFDRGIFTPWKQLLKMGRIKPSQEAIEMFMSSGEQMLKRVEYKIREIGMEDIYYAILTPSQAALMLWGMAPPAPKETAKLMREIFVKKERMFEEEHIRILEKTIQVRKDLEHGTRKDLSGKEVDDLLKDAQKFLKRIETLFSEIEVKREKESVTHIYETAMTIVRDIMRIEGIERRKDRDILVLFREELIEEGKVPDRYLRILTDIVGAKKDFDAGRLSKATIEKVKKTSQEFIKFMIEYMQRKRGREIERCKIRVRHGERFGEILLLDKTAFIIHDIEHEDKEISKAPIRKDGSLGMPTQSSLEELEKHLATIEIPEKAFIKEPIFENLRELFGKDVEVLINY